MHTQSFYDDVGKRRPTLIIYDSVMMLTAEEAEKSATSPQICCRLFVAR